MRVQSWTGADTTSLGRAFAAEQARWRRDLAWDTRDLWPAIERGRQSGRLPGLVARGDDGALAGWTYFVVRDGDLQVGGLSAREPAVTAALLDALVARPEAEAARRVLLFAFSDAPGLDDALATRGFAADGYAYLERVLSPQGGSLQPGRPWDLRDLEATADLLRASYPAADPYRPFAPGGQPDAWRQYVGDLVMGQGCGRFRPTLSVALPGDDGRLEGVALVTDIGERSAHLAQLAVRPDLRGAGLGARLLAAAERQAAAAGFARLTLLVADGNARARAMYARAGFVARARFACAARAAGSRAGREAAGALAAGH